ncbi:hypothetical protein HELRODRAFT_166841 [Helobdella robusta]|uniref:PHD-type domain-containing protein n=1 Tax=Helobdella robusta TaxID=6412 RepID=T1EYM0_HELRO|nr:hypothetical protein HELRODRAFT_166841 [Helobdella robusta]ESO11796.1 hypothetical protein HELRODRAFT_166841 [Helobdella robusta]
MALIKAKDRVKGLIKTKIVLGANKNGDKLVVRSIINDHNHVIVPETFQHTSQQRKLCEEEKQQAELMIGMGANPTKVKEYLSQSFFYPELLNQEVDQKEACLTCLGMPSKHCKSISFASKPTREKQKLILQWLFGSGQDYNISNIQSVPSQFLDGQVQECLYLLKDFLDLNVLKEMINKCSNEEWMCGTCSNDLRDVRSVSCDSCLKWFHFSCAGIKRPPSKKEWFCKACRK